ncbi:MAG: hypothetical protein ACKOZU_00560 [Planctomycetaceae bacterium]
MIAPPPALAVALLAHALDRVPGLVLGLPLVLVASLVFAATRHEDPAAIRRAALEWIGWLGGVLGVVLAAVVILAWLA